jgi:hypothetical protein
VHRIFELCSHILIVFVYILGIPSPSIFVTGSVIVAAEEGRRGCPFYTDKEYYTKKENKKIAKNGNGTDLVRYLGSNLLAAPFMTCTCIIHGRLVHRDPLYAG